MILLDKYFSLGDQALIRNQEVTITLQIPQDIILKVSPDLEYLIDDDLSVVGIPEKTGESLLAIDDYYSFNPIIKYL